MSFKVQRKTALLNLMKIEDEASKMIASHGRSKAIEYSLAKVESWREQVAKSLPCATDYSMEQMNYWRSVSDYLQKYNPKQHQ